MTDETGANDLSYKRQMTVARILAIKSYLERRGIKITAVAIALHSAHFDRTGVWHENAKYPPVRHETVGRYREYWDESRHSSRADLQKRLTRSERALQECRKTCADLRRSNESLRLKISILREESAKHSLQLSQYKAKTAKWIDLWLQIV